MVRILDGVESKIETSVLGKTAVLGKIYNYVHKNFGWAKARRQAPPLPHGSYATGITAVLRVREVFPGSGRVLGIQVGNNYISLPGELFENMNESSIELNTPYMQLRNYLSFSEFVASFYLENISHLLPGRK